MLDLHGTTGCKSPQVMSFDCVKFLSHHFVALHHPSSTLNPPPPPLHKGLWY